MTAFQLSSTQNPKIKEAAKLHNRRLRDEIGLFLIEGYRELSRAFLGGVVIEKLFFCPSLFLGKNEEALIEKIGNKGGELLCCTKAVFEKLSYRDRPDGLCAIARQMRTPLDQLSPCSSQGLYLVAEAIEKPGNLGSILRSADGAGADGVILCDRCTDLYNPNVVRASVGTLFTQPAVEATSLEVFDWLSVHQISTIATSPDAKELFYEVDLKGPIAIVVGTEQLGLSQKWLERADLIVSIPMQGVADSLNVATATTLLLYEVLRQRTGRQVGADLLR